MILNLYSVYDKVLGVYGPIIESQNDKVLLRQVKEMMALQINNPKNDFIAHAQDLIMYRIGERNTDNGDIIGAQLSQVFLVSDLKKEVESELNSRKEQCDDKEKQ